jgi:hypothetical protein
MAARASIAKSGQTMSYSGVHGGQNKEIIWAQAIGAQLNVIIP